MKGLIHMIDEEFNSYNLDEEILKALEKLGYNKPTKVQKEVIPLALKNHNLIVKSQTGSGKTAAFGIPLCEIIDVEVNEPQALILSPTRELCMQIKQDISNIGRFKRIRCAAVFGKMPIERQICELRQRVHIVAGTPGRVMDHIKRETLKLENIKYLIIDEADKMLSMGFIDQVEDIINTLPKDRITMLFSATMPERIEQLCKNNIANPVTVDITPENVTGTNIAQEYYEVKSNDKFNLIEKLIYIENPNSCILFCRTKANVEELFEKMKDSGFSCQALHGGMEQKDRFTIMSSFKKGKFDFLVATDVAARGIDVEEISHIINYDIPLESENYVHRIGRTGRAGKQGKAISLVTPYEHRFLEQIEEYIGLSIPKKAAPSDDEAENAKKTLASLPKPVHKLKADKSANLNKEITKLYINGGKKKKIRAGDIVGAVTSIEGVNADDIGIIDIQDSFSYFDILNGKGKLVLDALVSSKIKGKVLKVQKAAR